MDSNSDDFIDDRPDEEIAPNDDISLYHQVNANPNQKRKLDTSSKSLGFGSGRLKNVKPLPEDNPSTDVLVHASENNIQLGIDKGSF
jgi:hypothetical protein